MATSLLNDLIDRARRGSSDPRSALAVLADFLVERGDPLGPALQATLHDVDLAPLGIERYACSNDTEGRKTFDVPVFAFLPFARAIGLAPGQRAADTEFVLLPPPGESGAYRMGGTYLDDPAREAPPRDVTVAPYLIARTALSQRVFRAACAEHVDMHPRRTPEWTAPVDPMAWVGRDDAIAACRAHGLRLPTEAEWEHACRGGTHTRFCFGERVDPSDVRCDGTQLIATRSTALAPEGFVAVDAGPANAYGLLAVHGNVGEWVDDQVAEIGCSTWASHRRFVGEVANGAMRRGGGWKLPAKSCASASRVSGEALESGHDASGIRFARTPRAAHCVGLAASSADFDERAASTIDRARGAGPDDVAALCTALLDEERSVRAAATAALVRIGPPAIPALLRIAPDSAYACEALAHIERLTPEAIDVLRPIVDGAALWYSTRALMRLGLAGAAVLIERVEHPTAAVRFEAAKALGRLRSASALPALSRADAGCTKDTPSPSVVAARALHAIAAGTPPPLDPLDEPWPEVPDPPPPTEAERRSAVAVPLDRFDAGDRMYRYYTPSSSGRPSSRRRSGWGAYDARSPIAMPPWQDSGWPSSPRATRRTSSQRSPPRSEPRRARSSPLCSRRARSGRQRHWPRCRPTRSPACARRRFSPSPSTSPDAVAPTLPSWSVRP